VTVRLITLDNCLKGLLGHTRETLVDLVPKASSTLSRGESDSPLLVCTQVSFANAFNECPSEMIEYTPEVVQNLTKEQAVLRPEDGDIGNVDRKGRPWSRVGNLIRFGIWIGMNVTSDGVLSWIESGQKLGVENIELLLSPSQLGFTVFQSIPSHDFGSLREGLWLFSCSSLLEITAIELTCAICHLPEVALML